MTRGNVWFIITSLDQVSISIVNFGMFYCCLILTIYKCLLLSVSVRSPWTVKYLLMCLSTTHVSKNTKKVQKVHAFHVRVQLKLWICSDGALKAFFFFFFLSIGRWVAHVAVLHLTNRPQFSTVYTGIEHAMFKIQVEPGAAQEWFRCQVFNINFYGVSFGIQTVDNCCQV